MPSSVLRWVWIALFLVGWQCPIFGQTPISQITAVDVADPTQDWGLSYFNLASSSVELANTGASSWFSYHYLAANYRYSFSRRLSIRLPFTTTTPGVYDQRNNTRQFDTQLADIHFVYNDFQFKEFPNEWDLSASFYLYLPTSQTAKERGWFTRLRAWFNLEKKLNRRTLFAVWLKPDYYFNTQKAYRSERVRTASDGTTFTQLRAFNNQRGELETSLVLNYSFNRVLAPQVAIVYTQNFMEDSVYAFDRTTYRDSLGINVATWVQINQQLRFLVGYSTQRGLTNALPWEQGPLGAPSQSEYTLMTFWNFF
ncbi:MAG: hypothetical protein NZ480_00330 [Bdellovibrionaceae bacterium]|nr:hypothetical protein [Pseudobdellovibrionaceae bacterium]MDW8190147.1 hypothetical protein [Pseudobdellovibrionaceae bacterium]